MDRSQENLSGLAEFQCHDSAAVLLEDGAVVFACEQERLNRIKHTNKFPNDALRSCISSRDLDIRDVDRIAVYRSEQDVKNAMLSHQGTRSLCIKLGLRPAEVSNPRALYQALLRRDFDCSIEAGRLQFVRHHEAHAYSAFIPSGFDRALVVTLDGEGDSEAGSVAIGCERRLQFLQTTALDESLGLLYLRLTIFLGFHFFDEYKVMGLAPYGDAARFRDACKPLYMLLPDGRCKLHPHPETRFSLLVPRRLPGEPLEQAHKDLAAAVQEVLENAVFHKLRHFRDATGLSALCLAGGVAHNCTLTGKVLQSGLFSRLFVQPASHDAGCALGAALCAAENSQARRALAPYANMYLGTDAGDSNAIALELRKWEPLIEFTRSEAIAGDTARLLAEGHVVAWVQGRAEFGPRALGNRSILADPRRAENREIINAIVKKRESFRPFAPAVLVEHAKEYFELPTCEADLSSMTYAVKVREEYRAKLPAVTHVDGTARVQTVSRVLNERFWELISQFEGLTTVPVLLNTSFNNNAEPIVDSVDDAVVCFLTTELPYLVVGDFVVSKKEAIREGIRSLIPSVPRHVLLRSTKLANSAGTHEWRFDATTNATAGNVSIRDAKVFSVLGTVDGEHSLGELLASLHIKMDEVLDELIELWFRRIVLFRPQSVHKL